LIVGNISVFRLDMTEDNAFGFIRRYDPFLFDAIQINVNRPAVCAAFGVQSLTRVSFDAGNPAPVWIG